MEPGISSTSPHSGLLMWIDKVQRSWSGIFEDERQEAVWNKASASALYLMMWVSLIAALGFMTVDYDKYSSCIVVLFLIAVGGPAYARAVARRQNVRPVVRVPSWRSTAVNAVLFGIVMVTVTRAMDPGSSWPGRVVSSAVIAVVWAVAMRALLKRRHDRMQGNQVR